LAGELTDQPPDTIKGHLYAIIQTRDGHVAGFFLIFPLFSSPDFRNSQPKTVRLSQAIASGQETIDL